MPQLNFLPVNVSQSIELKDETTSFDSTTSKDDFSKYIDLHLNKSKGSDSKNKIDGVKPETNMVKNSSSSTDAKPTAKKPDDLADSSNTNNELDSATHEQKVAASGNKDQIKSNKIDHKALDESEELMSFLTKADNTLLSKPVDTSHSSSSEQLSTEQTAHYEAQLLLNSSNLVADLSAVAKALGNDQANASLAPTLVEQVVSDEEALLSNATKDTSKAISKEITEVKLSGELLIEGKSKDNKQAEAPLVRVKAAENKTGLSELEAKANSGVKVGNISGDTSNIVSSGPKAESIIDAKANTAQPKAESIIDVKANTAQQKANQTLPAEALIDRDLMSKNNEETSLTAEQKVAKQIKNDQVQMSNDKTTQNSLSQEAVQSSESEILSRSQLSDNTLSESNSKNQAPVDAVKSLEKTVETQVSASKKIQSDKISSLPDAPMTKNALAQSSEATTPTEKANQSATNDLIQDNVNKTQAKENEKVHLSSVLADQSQQKPVVQNDDGVLVEDNVIEGVKREQSTNRHVIDIGGRTIQTPQEVIEQQSAEMLNPSVATEVSQSQKTNAQLHQETISLFRKDFTEAVKDKVMLMISQKLQRFDITLDPPELGNMQVRVNLQGEQAVVSFLVQSQQTKDALEQNMHKLKEMLAEQGVDVGDANVEQQSQQSSNKEGFTAGNQSEMGSEIDNMAEANDVVSHTLSAQMIDSSTATVDYYA